MSQLIRSTMLSLRDLWATAGPFILLAFVLIGLAYWVLDPNPPDTVVLATGPQQSAYEAWGQRYAEELKAKGFHVELRTTDGSVENLRLLMDKNSGVDLAFVRNGSGISEEESKNLMSLSGLFQEPIWIFVRHSDHVTETPHTLAALKNLKINVGETGSGASHLVAKLWALNGLQPADLHLSYLPDNIAIGKMLDGELDAVAVVSAPESPLIQMLLMTPDIGLVSLDQSEAYSRRLPQVQPVDLPRGIVDLAQDVPPSTVDMVAATTMLVTRKDTHPALRQLFVQTADKLHRPAGWFQSQGEFPSRRDSELPIDPEATRFYDNGQPLLQRYLPFGLANLVDRMWVVIVSLIAILLPLSRIVPPLYVFRIRSRIFKWYGRLREIEVGLSQGTGNKRLLLEELDALDRELEKINVPLAYAEELYALRSHVNLVRRRVQQLADPQISEPLPPSTPRTEST